MHFSLTRGTIFKWCIVRLELLPPAPTTTFFLPPLGLMFKIEGSGWQKKKRGRVTVRENISFLAKLSRVWWKSPSGVRHHLFWLDTGSCFKLVGTHYSKVFSFFLNTYNWFLNSQRYYSPPKQKENAERSAQTRSEQALNFSTIIIVRARSLM